MKGKGIRIWSAERLSSAVLYALIALSVFVFAAFYIIGYERPFDENPTFNAPLMTNVLLIFMFVVFVAALGAGIWGVMKGFRQRSQEDDVINGIPVARFSYGIAALTAVLMLLTFAFGSSSAIWINGIPFADSFWLKAADMFIISAAVLILIAVGVIIFGYIRHHRKEKM